MKKEEVMTRLYCAIFGEKLRDFMMDDKGAFITDGAYITDENLNKIYQVIGNLSEREQRVLGMRFGYENEDGQPRTLDAIANEFNVTRERIRWIEQKALRKLRHRRDQLPRILRSKAFLEEADEITREIRKLKNSLYELTRLPVILTEDVEAIVNEETYIDDLGLSVRAYNCLKRAEIFTVEDLCCLKKDKLYAVRNLGRKGADEIIGKLVERGLSLP